MSDASTRYLRLGLRIGRLVEGIVDSYFGPPELAAAVEAEPPAEPRALADEADALLARLDDGWLRDQVAALRTYAGVLGGEELRYADEVEGCYGIRPSFTDEAGFGEAHARLDELLPGDGPLAERHARWERETAVPPDRVADAVRAVAAEARAWTRRLVELPAGEGVDVGVVRDKPWLAFACYTGGLRSRIEVNVDLPISAIELLHLTLHETYPGHHAERCLKDQRLVRGRGLLEEAIVLVPTPQAVVSEGIAEIAPALVLEGDGGPAIATAGRRAGVDVDLPHALAVERATEPLRWAYVNAALMLHERGAAEAEVRGYLERWSLATPELSAHLIRFMSEPTSRTYVIAYPAGRELCRAWVGGEPARFGRLLGEQMRLGDLLAAASG